MFTLRIISSEGVEMNFALGSSYTLIDKQRNPKEFERTQKLEKYYQSDKFYGFVSDHNGEIHCLSNTQYNFIMTEGGQTFANITFK